MTHDTELSASDAARFAAIVACSSDAIISKSLDGIVQTWNPAAEALFGWNADEMIGQSITRIIPDHLLHEEDEILASIRRDEIVPKFQTVRLSKDGELIPIAVTISPVRDGNGRVVGASKIANDMRAQTRLRDQLRQTSDQFTALANNIPQLAWIADPNGWLYWYNQRWYDYTGTTLEDMQGWGWRDVHHPDHVDRVVEKVSKHWESGEPWEDTFPLRRHDGEFRWFLSRANPLRDEEGNVLLWCGSNTDITERIEASERIAMLMREVNHRSRNMLATIQAMLNRSRYETAGELSRALSQRITALSSNQQILDGGDWSGARIVDIATGQIGHVEVERRGQIEIEGPENLILASQQAEAFGLAIHELTTNAAKYGALSQDLGRVRLSWRLENGQDDCKTVAFCWHESGGPRVEPPTRVGFGTLLIKRNLEGVFGVPVSLDFAPDGLRWSFSCAADKCLIKKVERVETESYL